MKRLLGDFNVEQLLPEFYFHFCGKEKKNQKIEYCDVRGQEFEKIIKFHFVNSALVSHKSSNFYSSRKIYPLSKNLEIKTDKKTRCRLTN